jgi:acetate kinase
MCFDTSFHTTCNALSQRFAIPKRLHDEGVRRYGFHGLSYGYIVSQFDRYLPVEKREGKMIIAHLGAGASLCAVSGRKSVATSLSFSALDGLPMGTRCGNIDPGAILYLMETHQMDHAALVQLLYKESGLLGLSNGLSADMRELERSNSPDAKFAIDVFVYKIAGWMGMLAAELQGLDGLIFTAGMGENSAHVRAEICQRMAWLGAEIDLAKNARHETAIHAANSRLSIHVIPTDEEQMIAAETLRFLS